MGPRESFSELHPYKVKSITENTHTERAVTAAAVER